MINYTFFFHWHKPTVQQYRKQHTQSTTTTYHAHKTHSRTTSLYIQLTPSLIIFFPFFFFLFLFYYYFIYITTFASFVLLPFLTQHTHARLYTALSPHKTNILHHPPLFLFKSFIQISSLERPPPRKRTFTHTSQFSFFFMYFLSLFKV